MAYVIKNKNNRLVLQDRRDQSAFPYSYVAKRFQVDSQVHDQEALNTAFTNIKNAATKENEFFHC